MVTKTRLLHDTIIIPSGSVATTQSATDNTTKVATTAYVTTAIANLSDSAPSTLNTLNELAAALGDDANFSTTVTNSIAAKLPLAGGTISGTVIFNSAPTFNTAITMGSTLNVASSIGIAGTTVIDGNANLTNIGTISSGDITIEDGVTPALTLSDTGNGGNGGASGKVLFKNTGGDAMGIGYTNNVTSDSDMIISTNAGGTYGGYLGLDAGGINDAKADIVLEPKTNVYIATGNLGIGTSPGHKVHVHGGGANTNLVLSTNDGYVSEIRMMEDAAGTQHGGFIRYDGNGDYVKIGHYNTGSELVGFVMNDVGKVGIGEITPLGNLHVKEGDSGASADASADELVIEGSGNSGLSILSGSSDYGTILFSDSGDSAAGRMRYEHNNNALNFGTNGAWDRMYINSSGNVGIGTISPDTLLHVFAGSAGSVSANSNADLVIEDNDHVGLQFLSPADKSNVIYFGDANNDDAGGIYYTHDAGGSDSLRFEVNAGTRLKLKHNGGVEVGDGPAVSIAANTLHVRENSSSGIHFPIVIGGGTHSAGAAFGLAFDPEGYGNRNKIAILAEGIGAGYSRGRLHFCLDNVSDTGEVTLADSKMCITESGKIGIGAQVDGPSGTLDIRGGRAGIISTDSSWGQFRVANSGVGEVGITVANGCTASEYLSDTDPGSSNKFIMGIHPYGAGTDTWGIGHGNLGDSVMHIDGSGNFGFGVNTDNPLTFFEISKSRPNVNQPSDYELKMTLNTYGYVGSNYKLGMIQFVGGDTASAQDNFYAGVSARAVNGANHQEDGALQFHVRSDQDTETLAVEINGEHNTGSQIAGSGSTRNGMMFRWQGIAIDRSWANYPGIAVMNSSDYSTSASTQAEFRVHGTNGASSSYPSVSGSDFSVNFRIDGSYITGSDRRRKTNITTIPSALEKVNQLTGKRFQTVNRAGEVNEHQSKADNYKFGLIAQEVENIIPEATKYYADEDDGTEDWNSAYSIDYASLTALLVNAIKEQDTVIQDLKTRIETLEG